MSKGLKITLAVVGFFVAFMVVVGITLFASYISANNEGAQREATIKQLNSDSENKLSTYTLKIQEKVQIPKMYTKELKEVIRETFQGRYGENGSVAVMQWIQEQNIPFDSSMFKDLQVTIDAGREEFRISQSLKLQACRDYEVSRNLFWKGFWLKTAGYPKANSDVLCRVVSDSRTQEVFENGKQEAMKFE